jgi:hypothetical protein
VLQRSAAAYEAIGDPAAGDRYYRSARCLAGTENTQQVRELANKAMVIATTVHDEQLKRLIGILLSGLPAAHAP